MAKRSEPKWKSEDAWGRWIGGTRSFSAYLPPSPQTSWGSCCPYLLPQVREWCFPEVWCQKSLCWVRSGVFYPPCGSGVHSVAASAAAAPLVLSHVGSFRSSGKLPNCLCRGIEKGETMMLHFISPPKLNGISWDKERALHHLQGCLSKAFYTQWRCENFSNVRTQMSSKIGSTGLSR